MRENFDRAMEFVARWEGIYSDDAGDRGGPTYMGISSRYWPKQFAEIMSLPYADRKQYAINFYRKHFWDAVAGDTLPTPLDMVMFDSAVNCGTQRALAWMGEYGTDWRDVLLARLRHYSILAKDPTQRQFLRGWVNRVVDLWTECRLIVGQ